MSENDMSYEEWLAAARKAAEHYWCYPDMVDDDLDTMKRGWEAGHDPSEFIKELGQELDLHEFGKAWGGW